jgi:hypothetical protein
MLPSLEHPGPAETAMSPPGVNGMRYGRSRFSGASVRRVKDGWLATSGCPKSWSSPWK